MIPCPNCAGSGIVPADKQPGYDPKAGGPDKVACKNCNGTGNVMGTEGVAMAYDPRDPHLRMSVPPPVVPAAPGMPATPATPGVVAPATVSGAQAPLHPPPPPSPERMATPVAGQPPLSPLTQAMAQAANPTPEQKAIPDVTVAATETPAAQEQRKTTEETGQQPPGQQGVRQTVNPPTGPATQAAPPQATPVPVPVPAGGNVAKGTPAPAGDAGTSHADAGTAKGPEGESKGKATDTGKGKK